MCALDVQAVILTGMEPVWLRIAKPAHRGFVWPQRNLIQRIKQVRTRKISIKIMARATWGERVVQNLGRSVGMKCQQAGAIVRDGRTDKGNQLPGERLTVGRANEVGYLSLPGGTIKYSLQRSLRFYG